MPPATGSPPSTNRRELYREYLSRFNPAEIAQDAFEHGNLLDSISQDLVARIATKAELNLGSQQLLVGGIGTGKSTILWRVHRELALREISSSYLDCSLIFDLSAVATGSLLSAVLIAITSDLNDVSDDLRPTVHRLRQIAFGGTETFIEPDLDYLRSISINLGGLRPAPQLPAKQVSRCIPAKLKPLSPLHNNEIQELVEIFETIRNHPLSQHLRKDVLLLDGFDRVHSRSGFFDLISADLRALKQFGLTTVVAGPLSAAYGAFAEVQESFYAFHHILPIEPDELGARLLNGLLSRRRAFDLLSDKLALKLAAASGGILRDLIVLVKDAAENAYSDGQDFIQEKHVHQAIDQLGSTYLKTAGSQASRLSRNSHRFDLDPSDSRDLELLQKRLVIERKQRFEVHPALTYAMQHANM